MALAGRQLQKSGAGSTGGFTSAKVVKGLSVDQIRGMRPAMGGASRFGLLPRKDLPAKRF